jgi:hypothetical protein
MTAMRTSAPSSRFFDELQEMQLGLLHLQLGALYALVLVNPKHQNSAALDRTWDKRPNLP